MHDELLMWASERGWGTLDSFREAHDWLRGRFRHSATPNWRISLFNMQALGHAEVDWDRRVWSVTPPVMTTLPNTPGLALLSGQRPIWLIQILEQLPSNPDTRFLDIADSVMPLQPESQTFGPSLRRLRIRNTANARKLSQALGIKFVDHAADKLLLKLPRLQEMLNERGKLHGPGGLAAQKISAGEDDIWIDADDGGRPPLHGTYRYQRYNTHRYVYWIGEQGFVADKRSAIYAELARTRQWVLSFSARRQELYVPKHFPLPMLHARAATLCSGRLPQLASVPSEGAEAGHYESVHRGFVKYVNIDERFARLLAQTLYQELQSI